MLSKKHEADKFKQLKFAMSAPMYNSLDEDQKKYLEQVLKMVTNLQRFIMN